MMSNYKRFSGYKSFGNLNLCNKSKKIASRSFKDKGVNAGFQFVYAHFVNENWIVLIELYHKSKKEIENKDRIINNFK